MDRLIFVWLYRLCPSLLNAVGIIKPATVLRWHRGGFRLYWRWKLWSPGGRPKISREIRQLIRAMSLANPLWGAPRMGIRDRPTAPRSPWQNAYAERLVGSIRRECLDHIIVLGEAYLHRILKAYASYYNNARTHLSLRKDASCPRSIERTGRLTSVPILADLHHQYCRT